MRVSLHRGDCREVLRDLPDNSVDAVVTDPPYELGFMGKKWDGTGIAYQVNLWKEVYRVLKPGGHLLSFGGTRTYHRMACAIEDAGFEIRDQIQWLYGSGFPKSFNISKGIDKRAGAEREVIGRNNYTNQDIRGNAYESARAKERERLPSNITAPATPEAQQWDGWGSALKPANEPVCLARKPLSEKTIVENVLKWGTGGINVDGCRVGTEEELGRNNHVNPYGNERTWSVSKTPPQNNVGKATTGRFPANFIHDGSDEVVGLFPQTTSGGGDKRNKQPLGRKSQCPGNWTNNTMFDVDSGSAARFFYCAKASRSERNAGLEGMPDVDGGHYRQDEWSRNNMGNKPDAEREPVKNNHPTVKPISLMRYLCRLITPPNGVVLDPFMGSGTTGCAAVLEGFDFIGIEQDAEYLEIAKRRIEHWQTQFTIELQPSLI